MTNKDRLLADLEGLGLEGGDDVMVHASLRSLGELENGAEGVIQALLESIGEEGTLLFPALSYRTVSLEQPVFDLARTPSCVGALPEYFRLREGTMRSLHPTHSVCAVGKRAEWFVRDHEKDTTPCGPNSPFRKLPQAGGKILFIGCGLRPNTSMHAIEELVEPPYLYGEICIYEIRKEDGQTFPMRVRNHGFEGWEQRYDRVAEILHPPALTRGRIGHADSWLMESRALWEKAEARLQEDPLFFVDRIRA